MIDLPQQYKQNMQELLKDEYEEYLNSFKDERVYGLRVNTNKISVEDFLKISPFKLEPIPWTNDGFYFNDEDKVSKHPYYYAGLYYIQEPSAMLPAETLPVKENNYIFDACAAPGGKSHKLLNKLNKTGLLVSNDISVSRAQVLLKTLESSGHTNFYCMAEDINNLDKLNNSFDAILVDAPCSGEGMFRKDNSLIKSWLDKGNDYYASIQKQIITSALKLLKDGGYLVYSTCTFSIKEDEEIIEYALNLDDSLKVFPIKMYEGFVNGQTPKTKNCVRLYPHKIKGEGHFVSLLQKGNNNNTNIITNNEVTKPNNSFFNNINYSFNNGEFIQRENKLYFEPKHDLNLKGYRILRSGLYLGEYKHDKFEPSQSLALALYSNNYTNIINFDLNDNRVIKYLKCETLDVKDQNKEGIVLVCVNNYPLGFGQVKQGILKNKLPSNYRYI